MARDPPSIQIVHTPQLRIQAKPEGASRVNSSAGLPSAEATMGAACGGCIIGTGGRRQHRRQQHVHGRFPSVEHSWRRALPLADASCSGTPLVLPSRKPLPTSFDSGFGLHTTVALAVSSSLVGRIDSGDRGALGRILAHDLVHRGGRSDDVG